VACEIGTVIDFEGAAANPSPVLASLLGSLSFNPLIN
jgi:hypothetical protein